jgi:predicted lipoprotein with Yx(FWY)xxD motif
MLKAHRFLLTFSALALPALGLAACGSDDDSGSEPTQAAETSGGQTISVESIGGSGEVLVDAQGRALYTNDQEQGREVVCTAECLSFWLPATGQPTSGDSSVQEELGTIKRPDGSEQITYGGQPLYSFVEDDPGQVTGDGFADSFGSTRFVWTVAARPGGEPSTSETTTSDSDDSGGGGYGGY